MNPMCIFSSKFKVFAWCSPGSLRSKLKQKFICHTDLTDVGGGKSHGCGRVQEVQRFKGSSHIGSLS